MSKLLLTAALCTLLALNAFSQISKSGKVTSDFDGNPLQGVSVEVKGTSTGTTTDAAGNFTIQVPNDNVVLVFSYTGFTTQELRASSSLNIRLSNAQSAMNEVVVIGYGTAKKSCTG